MKYAVHQRLRWLYEENPSGSAQTWLVLLRGTDAIGCGSIFPRDMLVGGQLRKSGILA